MTPDRAQAILEAYGASPARWPEAEREALLALTVEQPDLLADALAQEAELDTLLGTGDLTGSDLLERRVMQRFPAPASSGWSWRAPAAAAAAVLLAVSVSVGSGVFLTSPADEPDIEQIYADALYSYGMDWTSWYPEEET